MPYPSSFPFNANRCHRYVPSWWEDHRYDDPCYQDLRPALTTSRSSPCLYPRDQRVKIYVNVRYRHTSNHHTLLRDEVCVQINSRCCVMDVWEAAVECNPHLRHYYPTHKVLATDSHQCHFTEICSDARIKDEYHKSERHWVFVVRPPFNCVPDEKRHRRKHSSSSYFCGCC